MAVGHSHTGGRYGRLLVLVEIVQNRLSTLPFRARRPTLIEVRYKNIAAHTASWGS